MKTNTTDTVEVATSALIGLSDEVSRARAYLECVYLACEGISDGPTTNAIQSVMVVAQDKLDEVVARIGVLYGSPDAGKAKAA